MSLLDGLAAYWKFDEGTGTSAADATGNGNTGTLVGTVSWVSGFVTGEGAVNTVSGANYVSLTGAPVASLSQPFSVLLHVNSASVTATQTIFSEGSSSSDNPVFALLVPNTPTGKMRVLFRNNGGSSLIDKNGSIAVFDGNNHTILFRYDGSGNYETFIDGVKDTSLSGTFTPSGTLTINRSAIGALARTSYSFPCPGDYGSVGRWTRRLTDDEVAALYNSGAGLAYADFGGGGGTSDDLTANGISSAATVGTPALGQTHILSGAGVSSAATVASPAIGQTHSLAANGLASQASVGSPAVGQVHALAGEGIASVATVGVPAIGQVHALEAAGLSSTATVGHPELGVVGQLIADGVGSTATVGQPALGQVHLLDVSGVRSQATIGRPQIGQTHVLAATGVSSQAHVGTPSLGEATALEAEGVESRATVGSPSLGQIHRLIASSVTSRGIVGNPLIGQTHRLDAASIVCAAFVGRPLLVNGTLSGRRRARPSASRTGGTLSASIRTGHLVSRAI